MSKKKDVKEIDVLGTPYRITHASSKEDDQLKTLSGYCITSQKTIVIEADKLKDLDYTEQWVLRHELVHAFLHESGLDKEAPWGNEGEELFVDWIALQLPKMVKAMKEAGAL